MTINVTTGASGAQMPALTSLRFVAAFAVLLLHYRDLLGPLPPWLLQGIVGGQYGVTFFFVLSGFILTYRYCDWFASGVTEAGYWRFQRLRLARIYPIYVLGLLLDTPGHLIERARVGQLGEVGQTYWASWLLNLVGLQSWVPAVPYAMFWNTPAWSRGGRVFLLRNLSLGDGFADETSAVERLTDGGLPGRDRCRHLALRGGAVPAQLPVCRAG